MDGRYKSEKEKFLPNISKSTTSAAEKMKEKIKKKTKALSSQEDQAQSRTFSFLAACEQSDTSSSYGSSRYSADPYNDKYQLLQILRGNLDKIATPRYVRVSLYFSSNPQDSSLERSVLWKETVPSLREQCRELYDIEFELIDLNVGLDNGVFVSNEKRLNAIEQCQKTSISTAFVALISHKYWTPFLPTVIEANLFEKLLKVAYNCKFSNCRLIEQCYERDENAIPPNYVLKNDGLTIKAPQISPNGVGSKNKVYLLQNLLRNSAIHALNSKNITSEQADIFLISYLEEEIQKGVLSTTDYHASKSISYIRTINSFETDMNYRRIFDYIDMLPTSKDTAGLYVTDDMIDHDAQMKINNIREILLPEKVITSDGRLRVYKCAVTWKPKIGLSNDLHSEYLEDFNSQLQHVIQKVTAKGYNLILKSDFEHEALCHCFIAKSLYQSFNEFGQNEMSLVKNFFSDRSCNICVLHGSAGGGRTYLCAAIASKFREWVKDESNATCVVRFLGQTSLCCNAILLLDSISSQLEKLFDIEQEHSSMWCTDIIFQKKRLEALMRRMSCDQQLVVLLDGLEHLWDEEDMKSITTWFPLNFLENVKIILTINNDCSSFENIRNDIKKYSSVFIKTKTFDQAQASKLLLKLLSNNNRLITSGQLVFALQSLSKGKNKEENITPCHISFVFMHAIRWKSSKDVNKDTIGRSESDAIQQFIISMQEKYGIHLVRFMVALVSTSKFGITQQELEEIMYNHSSVANELRLLHISFQDDNKENTSKSIDIRGILSNTLRNLLEEMSPLLLKKLYYGCEFYTWSNSVIKSIIDSLYFKNPEQKSSMQKILVRYYVEYIGRGKYSNQPEVPLKTSHVAVELPFHLKDLSRESDALELCFLNIHWLIVLLRSFGIVATLFFLGQADQFCVNKRPILIVERSMRLASSILEASFTALPGEMFSRTSPFVKLFPSLKNFLTECTSYSFSTPSLLPAGMHAQAPGAPLRVSFVEEADIVDQTLVYASNKLSNLVYCTLNRLKVFDMVSGDLLNKLTFNGTVNWLKMNSSKKNIVVLTNKTSTPSLYVLDEKISVQKQIALEEIFNLDHNDEIKISIGNTLLALWEEKNGQRIFLVRIKSVEFVHEFACNHQIHSCTFSCDEQLLFTTSLPSILTVFSIATGCTFGVQAPQNLLTKGYIVNVFESFNNNLIGIYSEGFVQIWGRSPKDIFMHLSELDSRTFFAEQPLNVIHSSMSDDRSWLVVVKPIEVDVWNLKLNKTVCEISCRNGETFSRAYFCSEQKNFIMTLAENDLAVYIWDISSSPPACISILDGHSSYINQVVIPDLKEMFPPAPWLVTVSSDNSVKVWNLENLPLIPTLTMTGKPITKIFDAGNYIVTSDGSNRVTVWRVLNADIIMHLHHSAAVQHIVVSNWSFKVVTTDKNNFQYLWNLRNGENVFKIKGPEVDCLLITPNDQLVISIFRNPVDSNGMAETSKVWKLDTGQIVCTFDYVLETAQVTSNNTFLVGISLDRKLYAVSLWTGMLARVLFRPGADINLICALSWHDHVISLDSQNFVTIWNIGEETSLMSLDMKDTIMKEVHICKSGSVLMLADDENIKKILDVSSGKLRKLETFGRPIMAQLTWDGTYLVHISEEIKVNNDEVVDIKYFLVVVTLSGSYSHFIYRLEGIPTCMEVARSGRTIAIGLEEGRPIVFNIVEKKSKFNYSFEYKLKKTERTIYFPKENCDQTWFSVEPRYEEYSSTNFTNQVNKSQIDRNRLQKVIHSKPTASNKYSMHFQRRRIDDEANKEKTKFRFGQKSNTKIKVFM